MAETSVKLGYFVLCYCNSIISYGAPGTSQSHGEGFGPQEVVLGPDLTSGGCSSREGGSLGERGEDSHQPSKQGLGKNSEKIVSVSLERRRLSEAT